MLFFKFGSVCKYRELKRNSYHKLLYLFTL